MVSGIENPRLNECFRACFGIARWHAWTPGVTDAVGWRAWLEAGGSAGDAPDVKPDVGFLPALLRRRLDRLGRMALNTAWPCVEGLDAFEFVFGSRHGSFNRTAELLVALATGEPVSPNLFSLAVHNNVAGLFSIARGNRSAATAIAAGTDTLGMSIMEGAGMIADGAARVLVTYAEDLPPDVYRTLVPPPPAHPFAVSLLLTPAADALLHCALVQSAQPSADEPEVALMRFLTTDMPNSVIGAGQPWRLERRSNGQA